MGSVSDDDDEKSVEENAIEADPNPNNNMEDSRTGERTDLFVPALVSEVVLYSHFTHYTW